MRKKIDPLAESRNKDLFTVARRGNNIRKYYLGQKNRIMNIGHNGIKKTKKFLSKDNSDPEFC